MPTLRPDVSCGEGGPGGKPAARQPARTARTRYRFGPGRPPLCGLQSRHPALKTVEDEDVGTGKKALGPGVRENQSV